MNKSSKSDSGQRQTGRFDWIFSEFTIGVVLIVVVIPALYEAVRSLSLLPIVA
jgi:hypothetical protein